MTRLSRRFLFLSSSGSFLSLSLLFSFLLLFFTVLSHASLSSAAPLSFSRAPPLSSPPSASLGRNFSRPRSENSRFFSVSLCDIHSPLSLFDTFKAREEAKVSSSFQRTFSDSSSSLSSSCSLQATHKASLRDIPYYLSSRSRRKDFKPLFLFSSSSLLSTVPARKPCLSFSSRPLSSSFSPCKPSTNQHGAFQRSPLEEDPLFFSFFPCFSPSRLHQHHSCRSVSPSFPVCLLPAIEEGKKKNNFIDVPSSSSFSPFSPFSLDLHLLVCKRRSAGSSSSFSCLYATKKGGGSSKNGRDSNPKFLGVKKFGGEFVLPGHILVRQRGSRYKPGDGVKLCRDDSLTAVRSGFVDFNPVYKFEFHYKKRRWLQRHRRRIHAGYLVSVLDRKEDSPGYQKREKLALLRTLSSAWVSGEVSTSLKGSNSSSSFFTETDEENGAMASSLSGEEQEQRREEELMKV